MQPTTSQVRCFRTIRLQQCQQFTQNNMSDFTQVMLGGKW
jgi:hypothetical protein